MRGTEAILFLHPVAMDHRAAHWLDLPALLAPDLPGHGPRGVPRPGMRLEDVADEVAGWIREPVHVIGALYGGTVALHLALDHPELVASLVLADADAGSDHNARAERAARIASGDRLVEYTLSRWFTAESLAQRPLPEPIAYAKHCLETIDPQSHAAAWQAMAAHDVHSRLPEITAPTTVLTGSRDAVHTPAAQEAMRDAIPDARLVTIDAGHMSVLENPAAFSQAVRDHLHWVSTKEKP
jgi:3-oxoadipate enol-lactonase